MSLQSPKRRKKRLQRCDEFQKQEAMIYSVVDRFKFYHHIFNFLVLSSPSCVVPAPFVRAPCVLALHCANHACGAMWCGAVRCVVLPATSDGPEQIIPHCRL